MYFYIWFSFWPGVAAVYLKFNTRERVDIAWCQVYIDKEHSTWTLHQGTVASSQPKVSQKWMMRKCHPTVHVWEQRLKRNHPHYLTAWRHTQKRNPMDVVYVTKNSETLIGSCCIWEHTLERNHTHAMFVARSSNSTITSSLIWEHTLERNHTHVLCVKKSSHHVKASKFIWGYTLERNHTHAACVARHSQTLVIYTDIWEFILERNHTHVVYVIRSSQDLLN